MCNTDNFVDKLDFASIPVLREDRIVDHKTVDNININKEKGVHDATKYLISLGFIKIACIGGPIFISSSSQRFSGYKRFLLEEKIAIRDDYKLHGDFYFAGGLDACAKYKFVDDKSEAISATSDMFALSFINGLKSSGINLPYDLLVIDFVDI